jgi:hypothetical protein
MIRENPRQSTAQDEPPMQQAFLSYQIFSYFPLACQYSCLYYSAIETVTDFEGRKQWHQRVLAHF